MSTVVAISGAAAGATGSPYVKLLSFAAVAANANRPFTDANFSGLGVNIPCLSVVVAVANAGMTGGIEMSTDNGTTWKRILNLAATAAAGSVTSGCVTVILDSATTVRLNSAGGTTDIFIYVIGMN